jgi:hypothetical protein
MFLSIALHANESRVAFPSFQTLLRVTGLKRTAAYDALRELKELGLITNETRDHRRVFVIHDTPKVVHLSAYADNNSGTADEKSSSADTFLNNKPRNTIPNTADLRTAGEIQPSRFPGPKLEQQGEIEMGVRLSNIQASTGTPSSTGNTPRAKSPTTGAPRSVNPVILARARCVKHFEHVTHSKCLDQFKLQGVIDAFGVDETITIIEQAWLNRASMINEQYPNFTAGTVRMYATYKYKRAETVTESSPVDDLDIEIEKASNAHYRINRLRSLIFLRRLCRADLQGKIDGPTLNELFPPTGNQ